MPHPSVNSIISSLWRCWAGCLLERSVRLPRPHSHAYESLQQRARSSLPLPPPPPPLLLLLLLLMSKLG